MKIFAPVVYARIPGNLSTVDNFANAKRHTFYICIDAISRERQRYIVEDIGIVFRENSPACTICRLFSFGEYKNNIIKVNIYASIHSVRCLRAFHLNFCNRKSDIKNTKIKNTKNDVLRSYYTYILIRLKVISSHREFSSII